MRAVRRSEWGLWEKQKVTHVLSSAIPVNETAGYLSGDMLLAVANESLDRSVISPAYPVFAGHHPSAQALMPVRLSRRDEVPQAG